MKASGELVGSEASERAITRSQVADYVNRFRQEQSDIVNYHNDQGMIQDAQKTLDLFQDLDSASQIMTDYITQDFINSKLTWEQYEQGGLARARQTMMNFLERIPTTAYDEVNELFKNREKYTENQFRNELQGIVKNSVVADKIMETQSQYYRTRLDDTGFQEAIETRNEKAENALKFNLDELKYTTEDGQARFSGKEFQSILKMYDRINSMYTHGNLTAADGQKIFNLYTALWNNSTEAEQAILTQIEDFSESGLQSLNDIIDDSEDFESNEQKEALKTALANIFKLAPENINTAIQDYNTKMSKATEDYNKDISSATKGMDYKSAGEMAAKLGITTTPEYFDVKDGEMFLKDTSLLYDHYFGEEGLSAQLKEKVQEQQEIVNAHFDDINNARKDWDKKSEEDKRKVEEATGLTINELDQLYTAFEGTDESKLEDPAAVQNAFMKFAQTYYPDQFKGIEEQTKAYLKSTQLKS